MIDTKEALRDLVARAREAGRVALDTEFFWERTYYPRLGLVQLGLDEEDVHLIDTVAMPDLSPLGPLLADDRVVKILHDPVQDLTILRRATGTLPQNIFDTQRAAGFVGLSATISLADLFRELVDVDLPKTQTRTNWLQRPLTQAQIDYALDDVRYLPTVYDLLLADAEARGRRAWIEEEMAAYDDPSLFEDRDPQTQFERVSGKGRLQPRQLAVLQAVTAWREEEARRQDRPRGHVVPDPVLVQVARRLPRSAKDMKRIKASFERERYTDALVDAVQRGLAAEPDDQPERQSQAPISEVEAARIDFSLAYMKGKSLHAGVDPGLIASRSDLTAVVLEGANAHPTDHPVLSGWRRTFIGEELLSVLAGQHAVRLDPETGLPRVV